MLEVVIKMGVVPEVVIKVECCARDPQMFLVKQERSLDLYVCLITTVRVTIENIT